MWPEGDKTQQFLQKIKDGDSEAVNGLMDRHRQAVRRLIQMRLDNAIARRVDASDVLACLSSVTEGVGDESRANGMPSLMLLSTLTSISRRNSPGFTVPVKWMCSLMSSCRASSRPYAARRRLVSRSGTTRSA